MDDVGEWVSTTRADEHRERGRGGEDTGRQDDERARGGLEVRNDPRIRIYEEETPRGGRINKQACANSPATDRVRG